MITVLTIVVIACCSTHASVHHKHPIIHTNHPYLNIQEGSPIGTEIVVIDASSQTNAIVTVKPHDISTAERVKLVPVTVGVNSTYKVLTKQIPDREVVWTWYLTFQAHDNHSDTLWTLPLHIDDINDHAPIFSQSIYHAVIGYGTAMGSKVLHVTAVDADVGPNSAITYSMITIKSVFKKEREILEIEMIRGNDRMVTQHKSSADPIMHDPFVINPINGDITTKESLHHGELHYHYQVTATDSGMPRLSSTALVEIDILDFGVVG